MNELKLNVDDYQLEATWEPVGPIWLEALKCVVFGLRDAPHSKLAIVATVIVVVIVLFTGASLPVTAIACGTVGSVSAAGIFAGASRGRKSRERQIESAAEPGDAADDQGEDR